jgi:hypothetical protein
MKKVTPNHTRFNIPIELRFEAIRTSWTPREEKMSGEWCLVPAVSQRVERRLSPITDPEDIRKQFFRMKIDEKSALDFLNGVGVWSAVADTELVNGPNGSLLSGNVPVEMRLSGAFGHRWLNGRASIETVESLQMEQEHWRELRRNRRKLREAFAPGPARDSAPHLKDKFAIESRFGNTLEVHLGWRGKHPHAIIQPVTGRELLIALAWIDLVTEAECRVCQKCDEPYTRGGSKFCSRQCEHANTMRTYRIKLREKAAKTKDRPRKST